jgi:hypothetical protein
MTYTLHRSVAAPRRSAPIFLVVCSMLLASSCSTSPFYEGNRFETTVMADLAWRCADSDFEPVDQQKTIGLEADVRLPHDDVGLELGLFHSERDGTHNGATGDSDVKASMNEISAGGRWKYGEWILHSQPYASAGASLLFVSTSSDGPGSASQDGTDWTIGPYFRVGLAWPIVGGLSIAIDYRQVVFTNWFHDMDIDGLTTDANYSQGGIILGWTF